MDLLLVALGGAAAAAAVITLGVVATSLSARARPADPLASPVHEPVPSPALAQEFEVVRQAPPPPVAPTTQPW